jgi:hypothetical protein
MRCALVRESDNNVRNVIELDDGVVWAAPEGFLCIPSETLNIGDTYTEGE